MKSLFKLWCLEDPQWSEEEFQALLFGPAGNVRPAGATRQLKKEAPHDRTAGCALEIKVEVRLLPSNTRKRYDFATWQEALAVEQELGDEFCTERPTLKSTTLFVWSRDSGIDR